MTSPTDFATFLRAERDRDDIDWDADEAARLDQQERYDDERRDERGAA